MLGGLSINSDLKGGRKGRKTKDAPAPAEKPILIEADAVLSGNVLNIRTTQVQADAMVDLSLETLNIDGKSVLPDVVDASSPELAASPEPGRVNGRGKIVTALTQPLEVGGLYLVSYEIVADAATKSLYFPDGGGSPFPKATVAPFTVGFHQILVEAKDTDTAALLRVSGDLTFGRVSCRRAEWSYTLPDAPEHPELASQTEPGLVSGEEVAVSSLREPLEPGASYTLRYEIREAGRGADLATPADAGSPFEPTQLPSTVDHHAITLVAEGGETAPIVVATGDLTFGYFSCRRAGASGGRQIVSDVTANGSRSRAVLHTPDPGQHYVAPWGDDTYGTGAFAVPFASPARALAEAKPGDTVYLRPGTYAPFDVTASGAAGKPLTITTRDGEERQAVIEGDLMQHAHYGGPGVAKSNATRDGVYIQARDHVHIRNLTIRNLWRAGIFVVGAEGETHGHHILSGNAIAMTGSMGIFVGGANASSIVPLAELGTLRTDDVLIEHNDVSQTNVVTDYNIGSANSRGEPGGVTEAISVAALAGNVVTRHNDVHDTRQYGIDYKAGVRGGAIYGNRVWNVARYGIYLDSGRRFVEDVSIYNNRIWGCRVGIALAREAGSNTIDYATFREQEGVADFVQTLSGIDIYNNLIWDTEQAGMYLHRHNQKDGPDGAIRDVRVRFNTVFNANRSGTARDLNLSGWSDPDFQSAGVPDGIEFVGNIVYNNTRQAAVLDEFSGKPGFTVNANLLGTDPGFADINANPPDLSLAPGSVAAGLVDAEAEAAPFDLDIEGDERKLSSSAGAYAST